MLFALKSSPASKDCRWWSTPAGPHGASLEKGTPGFHLNRPYPPRGLEGVPLAFTDHVAMGRHPQSVIDQGYEFLQRFFVPLAPSLKETGYIVRRRDLHNKSQF
jgi:hypothetical protein